MYAQYFNIPNIFTTFLLYSNYFENINNMIIQTGATVCMKSQRCRAYLDAPTLRLFKRPEKGYPSDSDLHQMFVYYQYFGANKVVLLYPSTDNSTQLLYGSFTKPKTSCDLMFFPVPDWQGNGKAWQTAIGNAIEKWL